MKGKEVGTPLTLRTGGPPTAGGLSHIMWQDYNVDDDDDNNDDDDDDSRPPPAASESHHDRASPTPAAKARWTMTGAVGAGEERDKPATICLRSAGHGHPKSESCGGT